MLSKKCADKKQQMNKQFIHKIEELAENSIYYQSIINKHGMDALPIEMLNQEQITTQKFQILDKRISPIQATALYTQRSFSDKDKYELEIPWSYDDMQKIERSLFRKRRKWYGISCSDRYCRNHRPGMGNNPFRVLDDIYFSPHNNFISFSGECGNQNDWEKCLYYMNVFQPDWICFENNFFKNLWEYIKKYNLLFPQSIKYAEIRTNICDPVTRYKDLPFVHSVILYDSIMGEIAYECPQNHFHILDDLVFVESWPEQNCKQIIATNLSNRVFPLIRYKLPLSTTIEFKHCECGFDGDILIMI